MPADASLRALIAQALIAQALIAQALIAQALIAQALTAQTPGPSSRRHVSRSMDGCFHQSRSIRCSGGGVRTGISALGGA
jgi:hypothetical protein